MASSGGPAQDALDAVAPFTVDGKHAVVRVGVAPAQGGELKNIRRCLSRKKADPTSLVSTSVASLAAVVTTIKGALPIPVDANAVRVALWLAWLLIPVTLATGSVVVAFMRYWSALAAQDDEHMKAARDDVDKLIEMQRVAQEALDRQLTQALAEAATANRRLPPGT